MNGGKETLKGRIYATQTSTSPSFSELVFSDPEKKRDTQRRGTRVSQISISQLTSAINCSN